MTYLAKSGHAILLVEDDRSLARLYARMLHMHGHDVYVMRSGDEFVRFMQGLHLHKFDEHAQDIKYVALVDCNLPGMDGDEAVAQARQTPDGGRIRYIGMSGLPDNLQRFRAKGIKDVVAKQDIDAETLDKLVRAA